MNDFLTGREADSAGSLPWAGVWGLLFRSRILICLGQLAQGRKGLQLSGEDNCASSAVSLPGAFLSSSGVGCAGGSGTHLASPSSSLPSHCSSPPHRSSEACCQQLAAPRHLAHTAHTALPSGDLCLRETLKTAPQPPLCPVSLCTHETGGEGWELSSQQ